MDNPLDRNEIEIDDADDDIVRTLDELDQEYYEKQEWQEIMDEYDSQFI